MEITAFKKDTSVTADGTKYDYADTAEYNYEVLDNYTSTNNGTNLKDTTYNVYLDSYGYAIAVDQVETPKNYVFITGVDDSYSNLGTKNVKASAIFLDGTMKTIDITTSKGDGENLTDNPTLNSWFTYTVDKDGVYTVTKVASAINVNKNVKVAQAADPTRGNGDNQNIDKKHIYLSGAGTDGYDKVYGNDDTIYLTASIKEIKNAQGTTAIIIDGVDSVTTGLKNANIDPWHAAGDELKNADKAYSEDAKPTSSGVYTLYKSNGYIIASVVVGEDATASKNLVYVTSSSVEQESYDKTADEWTWIRKVALNGEEVELKEVSDSLTYLDKMDQYTWYQVKYNAEGEVIGVLDGDTADKTFDNWNLTAGSEYVTDIKNLDTAIENETTVLFSDSFTAKKMSMIGNVLFALTNDTNDNGFYVSDDVKVVLTQTNKNKTTTTFEVGAKALKNIVDTLNENNAKGYDYEISAIIESGVATTVVIRDLTNTYERPSGNVNAEDYTVSRMGTTITNVLYHTDAKHDVDTLLDVILANLEKDGFKDFKLSYDGSSDYSIVATDKRGIEYTFKWAKSAATEGYKISVDGNGMLVNVNATLSTVITDGTYAKRTKADASKTTDYANVTSDKVKNGGDGASYVSGFYKVSFTGTYTADPVYVQAGGKVVVKDITGVGAHWTGYTVSAGNFEVSNREVDSKDDSKLTVTLTAPATLDNNASVTFTLVKL